MTYTREDIAQAMILLGAAWMACPNLTLGQLINNSLLHKNPKGYDLFSTSDPVLFRSVIEFSRKWGNCIV